MTIKKQSFILKYSIRTQNKTNTQKQQNQTMHKKNHHSTIYNIIIMNISCMLCINFNYKMNTEKYPFIHSYFIHSLFIHKIIHGLHPSSLSSSPPQHEQHPLSSYPALCHENHLDGS